MRDQVWVIPSLDPKFLAECAAGLDRRIRDRLVVVDNTGRNRGVAASWNLGIAAAREADAEWLVICSESMRFGTAGGADFAGALTGGTVTARCDRTCTQVYETGAGNCRNGYGWHLVGIRRETIDQVGGFDEIFWPAWWEDYDWHYRRVLAGEPGGDAYLTDIDAHLAATEHSTQAGLVAYGWEHTRQLYLAKWGGPPGEEIYDHPYDNPDLGWTHTGPAPTPRGQPCVTWR